MKKRRPDISQLPARTAGELDDRLAGATPLRRLLNKVFPDHWSFLLGEIALYSFVVLLLTGTYLALFFDPSMAEVTYDGAYTPLRGIEMSRAYESTLELSFEVRGGLFMRQMHHWSALLFVAAILLHMLRVFFTGAFRKPRELNWVIGIVLLLLAFVEGLMGYSLPDDGLSGTGLRIATRSCCRSRSSGRWLSVALFDGEFPGTHGHRPSSTSARPAASRACSWPHHRAPGPAGEAEAHPVAGPRPHRAQRGRRAHGPGVRGRRPAASS